VTRWFTLQFQSPMVKVCAHLGIGIMRERQGTITTACTAWVSAFGPTPFVIP